MSRRCLVCFDVNETLLDLRGLDDVFRSLGGAEARRDWFAQLLLMSQTVTLADRYQDFSSLARLALRSVADRRRRLLDREFEAHLFARLLELPPHDDAVAALRLLREAGYKLAALTNSAPAVAQAQLAYAGLAPSFDAMLSVDAVRRYKPAPEPYRMAAGYFDMGPANMWMIAAHDWDILGAMAAGCGGVYIDRDASMFPMAWPQPELQFSSLLDAARKLTEKSEEVAG